MRLGRSVTAVVVALAAVAAGVSAAQASPEFVRDAGPPGVGAVNLPAQIVPNSMLPHVRTSTAAANSTSMNWSGYVIGGGGHSTVTASWTQPAVPCTSNGVVAFWAGLDGWGSSTVEQTGTGVDCRSGTPQYYAWWETFPTNSQQVYSVPVAPGDQITATVTSTNGQYELDLADATAGWSKTTMAAAPSGAQNVSAEVVTEAVSVNSATSSLPDFVSLPYNGISIDGQSLAASGAQPVDMINSSHSVIASTAPADASGHFTVTYTGGVPGVLAAFQEADGTLHDYNATGDVPQQLAMQAGTNPAITPLTGGGQETAYQATNGDLMIAGASGNADTGLGMQPGTSPSITPLPNGGYEIAFQSGNGYLWTYGTSGPATCLWLGMNTTDSPSITTLADGSAEIAFQANNGFLWTYAGASGSAGSLGLGMANGTSPNITALRNSPFLIAFQANSGFLWMYTAGNGSTPPKAVNQSLGMAAGTSPNVAEGTNGGFAIALQANTGTLWNFVSNVGASNEASSTDPMAAGTSPAIVAVPGGYESAFQTSDGDFEVFGASGPTVDTHQSMLGGTSPDIAP